MDISPLTSGRSALVATDKTAPQISGDFEMFLRMLTVQLKNQDPLNPVESADYAVQLATFSGVEQQVLTNDLLKDLTAQGGVTQLSQMGDWVGREVRVPASAQFTGAPVTLWTTPAAGADRAQLVVRDSAGLEVQRLSLPMESGAMDWVGMTRDGGALPQGLYSFTVESYAGEALLDSQAAQIYAPVTEVRAGAGGVQLLLPGGVEVDARHVTALRRS